MALGALGRLPLLDSGRPARHGLAPPHPRRLHIVRDDVLDRPRLPRLRNGQGSGVNRKKRRCNAREDQTREDRDWQDVLFDFLAALGLRRPEDDALHAVVDAPTRLEGNRVRGTCEVV